MLRASALTKRFGGVTALDGVDIDISGGEIHALVGENGAGKSTLVKVLCGVTPSESGEITFDGSPLRLAGPRDAASRGIAIVAQELSLFPDLTVGENLFLQQPRTTRWDRAAPVLAGLGLGGLSESVRVGELSLADRQLLEISRALLTGPKVLILDEPTSALPAPAVDRLHAVLHRLAGQGIAVLYISHFLQEVRRVADRISVLRDGRCVLRGVPGPELELDDLVRAMLGDGKPASRPASARAVGGADRAGVSLVDVSVPGRLTDLSLCVSPGEIVGVAGLEGAGHLTVLELVCGLRRAASGQVRLPGGTVPRSFRGAVRQGVAFIPGDRKRLGLMLDQTVWENATAVSWLGIGAGGWWRRRRRLMARAETNLRRVRFRGDLHRLAGELSGGNQQRVIFAKWLDADPSVLVLDDPTRGVDVGARAEMHEIIRELAAGGRVVLLASTDLAELTDLCHRVVVLRRGRPAGELAGSQLSEQRLSTAINTEA